VYYASLLLQRDPKSDSFFVATQANFKHSITIIFSYAASKHDILLPRLFASRRAVPKFTAGDIKRHP
jgi:hypothetical protein